MECSERVKPIIANVHQFTKDLQVCLERKNLLHLQIVRLHSDPLPPNLSQSILRSYIASKLHIEYLKECCRESGIRLCIFEERDKLNQLRETVSNVLIQCLISQNDRIVKVLNDTLNILDSQTM